MRLSAGLLAWLFLGVIVSATPRPASAQDFKIEYLYHSRGDPLEMSGLTDFEGKLYGTSTVGGVFGHGCKDSCGTIFAFDPTSGAVAVVYAFRATQDKFPPNPMAGLLSYGGALFGSTRYAGVPCDCGEVFRFDPGKGATKPIYAFQGFDDGAAPQENLIRSGGNLYGVTVAGGGATPCQSGCGVVFTVDPKSGAESVLHAFQGGADGAYPGGQLLAFGDKLYGTTEIGGGPSNCASGCGVVFALDPATSQETILHAFQGGADGQYPFGGLIAVGGTMYGTTEFGGPARCRYGRQRYGCGTLFALDPLTGAVSQVYTFANSRAGRGPWGNLIKVGSRLYGATLSGGSPEGACDNGCGTVFSFDLKTRKHQQLHSFIDDKDGAFPNGGFALVNGRLYGTTDSTIFSFMP
jgi:uncharacterized repeat protein (TIGR03803 family)